MKSLSLRIRSFAICFTLLTFAGRLLAQADIALPDPLLLGMTKGLRSERLIIRGATVISGRGTPRSNRATPPEGPIDIVIENGSISNMIPVDPVNTAGYQPGQSGASGDREIDAPGMYVIPGLVEMHAHLRGNGGDLGPRALDYQYLLYMAHGVTTLRDAETGAGLEVMTEQRRLSKAHEIVAPRLVLCQRWPLPLRQWCAASRNWERIASR